MRIIIYVLIFLTLGCSSNAQKEDSDTQQSKAIVENGILVSFEGIDLSKYELDVEDFDVNMVTKDHLLCLATSECDKQLVKRLLELGVNVNFKCEEVDDVITNLAFCDEGAVELARMLLKKGADVNGTDQDNASVLSYAISNNNIELTKFFLDNGASTSLRDTNRNTGCLPLHGCESVEMLKLLINKGFDTKKQCNNGRNLLHYAAKENLIDMAKYIVDNDLVSVDQKDKNGETALDYAKKYNRSEIEKILKK
jgi:ankyrin repeat protein